MRHVASISRAHNYLRIFGFYGEFYAQVIGPFCRANLAKLGKVPIPGTNRTAMKVTHVFARSNFDRSEYRLPASLLKEFLEFCQYRGYNPTRVEMVEEPELKGVPVQFRFKPGYENTRPGQDEWINYQMASGAVKVNNASTGFGKALANDTPVRTAKGWKPIGQIKVNDLVMAPDGSHTYVTGVFPQGVTPTYRLTFADGRSVVACPEHQWEVKEVGTTEWKVMTTAQLVANSDKRYVIPLTLSERNADNPSVIEPYIIGVSDRILLDKYLEGSHHQRLALLRGLLDVGGEPQADGSILYHSEYGASAKMVRDLVWSLGGIATAVFKQFDNRVTIRHRTPRVLFALDRKRAVLPYEENRDLALGIKQITPDRPQETTCIAVEHETHCFVIKDYIVTHNTYMALRTMLLMGVRTLITIQPRYITTWIKALGDIIDLQPADVLVWEQDLCLLQELMLRGEINPKVIIVPMSRIDVHFRNEKKDPKVPTLDKVFESLGCGLRIIDEGHEAIHQVCISLMYGNFPKLVVLSATLSGDDPFINKIYRILFPFHIRLKEPEPENYIDIVAYLYDINPRRYHLKTVQFGSYNDLTWEQSILNNRAVTQFYYDVAKKMFEEYYLDIREEGTKCLFFYSRVNMCEAMLEMFKKDYPDMDIVTFHGEDTKGKDADKTKYLKHEVVITTPGSCGTGKDIDGLVTVLCFHTVGSTQRNKQMIGRLRDKVFKTFDNRIRPRFVFGVCASQPKHKEYFRKREVAFEPKKKTFKVIDSNCALQ